VAIAIVVTSHAASTPDLGRFQLAGAAGVTLFFVLSGYLITSLLLEEHESTTRISVGRFYLRRAQRLFPALAVLLVLLTPAMLAAGYPWQSLASIPLYVSNWVQAQGAILVPLSHMWSLSVEEQFYLLWPLVLILALRRRRGPWIVTMLAIATSLALTLGLLLTSASLPRLYYGSDTHAVSLLMGCLLALGLHRHAWPRGESPAIVVIAVGALLCTFTLRHDSAWMEIGVMWASTLISTALVWAACDTDWRPLRTPALTWLGRRSYAIYLWHAPIVLVVASGFSTSPAAMTGAVCLSLVVAELSWRLVERRFLVRESPDPSTAPRHFSPVLVQSAAE
jgi:peptidoglycan/LPS O-acetylase OafA/YrhL